jgi:sec-independent protein translocase protein TatA
MPITLLIFESLGSGEMLVIAVVALIIFGPRKLPEIGRSVGKSIAEFKRASDDFKRTWEYEVELEGRKPALDAPQAAREAADASAVAASGEGAGESPAPAPPQYDIGGETVARASSYPWADESAAGAPAARAEGKEEEGELNGS